MRVSEDLSKNGIGVKVSDFSLSDLTEKNIKLQDIIEKLKYEISKKDKLLQEQSNYEILK